MSDCNHRQEDMDAAVSYDGWCPICQKDEIARLRAALAEAQKVIEPFAGLNVTRFMTSGLRYNFRVDAAWIRAARAVIERTQEAER